MLFQLEFQFMCGYPDDLEHSYFRLSVKWILYQILKNIFQWEYARLPKWVNLPQCEQLWSNIDLEPKVDYELVLTWFLE